MLLLLGFRSCRFAGGCRDALGDVNDVGTVMKGSGDRKSPGTLRIYTYRFQQLIPTGTEGKIEFGLAG